jgi:hypothetical protein
MAPEYSMGKAITVKADVYSFGVVLLEIVSGKVSADYTPNQEAEFLLDKVSGPDRINPLSFLFFHSYYQTKHVLSTSNNLIQKKKSKS